MSKRHPLPALLLSSLLALACSGDDGTAPPTPASLVKSGGDLQTGAPGATLPQPLEVRVLDGASQPFANHAVMFSASAGSVNPTTVNTDAQGRARTTLTLPNQSGVVTVTATAQGLPPVSFTATVVAPPMTITTPFLPAARTGVPYVRRITVSGAPTGGEVSFTLASGALPPGLALQPDGTINGTPTATGSFPFAVRAAHSAGGEGSQAFTLSVCEPSPPMSVGEVRVIEPSARGSCGLFLPAAPNGARYRITVVRTENHENGANLNGVSLFVRGNGVSGSVAQAAARTPALAARPVATPNLTYLASRLAANSREHARLLEEGEALARSLGTAGLLRPAGARVQGPEPVDFPDKIRLDPSAPATCSGGSAPVTGIKLAENDWLVVYQDSAQNTILSTRVTSEQAGRLIELATTYGKPIIDQYFGGVPDTDGNGKVILFITPAIGNALGKVWTGNFYRKADCPASNEGDYVYLDWEPVKTILNQGPQFGLHILVHELKHVSSLYHRLLRAGGGVVDPRRQVEFNPLWMEEGGAELAAELAGRYAWAERGGPGMNARVTEQQLRKNESEADITTENFSVLYMLFGMQEYLAFQPNSLTAMPPGASGSFLYSSGWAFQRWLLDAYGDAASEPFGGAALLRQLNDRTTPSGVAGIEMVTGRSWPQLMEEFSLAVTTHGQGVQVPRDFSSYDFITAIEMWCFAVDPVDFAASGCGGLPGAPGAFPWPVTTDPQGLSQSRPFLDTVIEGNAGPSGIRVHDLISNGTGQGAEINVEVGAPNRIQVVRIR